MADLKRVMSIVQVRPRIYNRVARQTQLSTVKLLHGFNGALSDQVSCFQNNTCALDLYEILMRCVSKYVELVHETWYHPANRRSAFSNSRASSYK